MNRKQSFKVGSQWAAIVTSTLAATTLAATANGFSERSTPERTNRIDRATTAPDPKRQYDCFNNWTAINRKMELACSFVPITVTAFASFSSADSWNMRRPHFLTFSHALAIHGFNCW